jgi:hypothetical protein
MVTDQIILSLVHRHSPRALVIDVGAPRDHVVARRDVRITTAGEFFV